MSLKTHLEGSNTSKNPEEPFSCVIRKFNVNLRMPTSGIKLAFRAAAATGLSLALAQRLCLTFDERFVGIEVEGRYIRICDDDTA